MREDDTAKALAALKEFGVRLSVDDFGTGYSSLSYLEQFPLDELKVDRSFVNKIDPDMGDAPIVSAIIAMAHSLRFCLVAEGVETDEQLDFLRRNGCEYYQGYLFSKPLPTVEFAALAGNWRPGRI
jgi:EAL domain-containing protein (putative c-di-GMP-specific phosphodiesterase class I)